MEFDLKNISFQKTIDLINNTDYPIFLSGKAGTGKTTFLRFLKKYTYKNTVVIAPTGVAAVNANGITIHSLFQLPITLINPQNNNLLSTVRFSNEKTKLLNEIELLIIDEISMVRSDILDAVDKLLKKVRNNDSSPFGGIQVLLIGDLYQLSPITKDKDLDELNKWYPSPFFFDAKVFQESNPICIELEKVYRQSEVEFVNLLNSIRNNTIKDEQLDFLNRRVHLDYNLMEPSSIFLTTHNKKVDELNAARLHQLSGQNHVFIAAITGEFEEAIYPAEFELNLKIGAQLMLLKNDKSKSQKYFNGKIGILEKIENEKLTIKFEDDQLFEVEKEIWRKIDYSYDERASAFLENEIGTFQQFPVRLAWAITIHKSQGLTFQKAIIDIGEAFLPGQIYVALSRVSSLSGLFLHSKINRSSINVDPRLHAFVQRNYSAQLTDNFSQQQELNFTLKIILQYFDWNSLIELTNPILKSSVDFLIPYSEIITSQKETTERFRNEIKEIFDGVLNKNIEHLNKRITAAVQYFTSEIRNKLLPPLKVLLKKSHKDLNYKKYSTLLQSLVTALDKKIIEFSELTYLSQKLLDNVKIGTILTEIKNNRLSKLSEKKSVAKQKDFDLDVNGSLTILSLFSSGQSVQDIAATKKLSPSAVEYQLASFIESGEVNILDLVSQDQLNTVMEILDEHSGGSLMKIKQQIGDCLSLGQINAVIVYKKANS